MRKGIRIAFLISIIVAIILATAATGYYFWKKKKDTYDPPSSPSSLNGGDPGGDPPPTSSCMHCGDCKNKKDCIGLLNCTWDGSSSTCSDIYCGPDAKKNGYWTLGFNEGALPDGYKCRTDGNSHDCCVIGVDDTRCRW